MSWYIRYLVCSRDLAACEIIIQQKPLAIGPIANCENLPVCLNCYRPLGSISGCYRYVHRHLLLTQFFMRRLACSCQNCKFPLCDQKCIHREHTKAECDFLKDNKIAQYLHDDNNAIELQHDYETIIILRYENSILRKSHRNCSRYLNFSFSYCISKSFMHAEFIPFRCWHNEQFHWNVDCRVKFFNIFFNSIFYAYDDYFHFYSDDDTFDKIYEIF